MGYPTAIQTFTTKNAGDTIQPADVNSPQTEITAIETGLINGLQHPISVDVGGITQSASTGSNNFAGPSSFAGTLSVTGTSTFTGNVTMAGTLTVGGVAVGGSLPAVRLTNSASHQIANNAWVGLSWDTEDSTGGMHSTSANSSRILFPSTGVYTLGAAVNWAAVSSGGLRRLRIVLNDSTTILSGQTLFPNAALEMPMAVSAQYRATSTTAYVTVQVLQNTGSTLSLADSTNGQNACWGVKVTA